VSAVADRDEHGARGGDPGEHRERRGGERQDDERCNPQQPRPRDLPEGLARKDELGEQDNAGPPKARIVKPRVASSPGWAIASSSPAEA
jgi:hypothetical protein